MNAISSYMKLILAAFSIIAVALLSGCGGGSSSGGSSVGWYYHWNCNGDSMCLSTNPTSQASGTVGPESGGQSGCNSLMTFGTNFWGIPPATQSCDNSPSGGGGSVGVPTITSFTPMIGSPGTAITVTGTNFTTNSTVTINGITISVSSASSTQIIFSVPVMGSFRGPITVTSPSGTVTSSGLISVINPLYGVTWSATKSLFVAVGENGTILTSPDAVTWTSRPSGVNLALASGLHGIGCSGTRCEAMGDNGYTITSDDGVNWTYQSQAGTNGIATLESVVWSPSGTQFVRVGSASNVSTSPDGVSWTQRSVPSDWYRGVVWTGTQFVAVGYGIITSPDGVTWTSRIQNSSHDGVAWSGALLVTAGAGGVVLTSPDGITWTTRTSGTTANLNAVTWSGSQFVEVGASGTILTSPDGITWTARTSGTTANLNGIASSGTQLVAVGVSGTILTSPNGINWTLQISP